MDDGTGGFGENTASLPPELEPRLLQRGKDRVDSDDERGGTSDYGPESAVLATRLPQWIGSRAFDGSRRRDTSQ